MAARKRITLTTEHRDRVAAGLATLSEVATELGISKQALYISFRRRLWPTTAIDLDDGERLVLAPAASAAQRPVRPRRAPQAASPSPPLRQRPAASQAPAIVHSETGTPATVADSPHISASSPGGCCAAAVGGEAGTISKPLARAPTAPASACSALSASTAGPAQGASPVPPVAPSEDDLGGVEITGEHVAEYTRRVVVAACLQAIERGYDILSRPIAATSLRAAVAAIALAADQIAKAGFSIEAEAQSPQLIIREMTAEQQEKIQATAEVEYHGEMSDDPVDDADEL